MKIWFFALVIAAVAITAPVDADFIVTLEGRTIETQGPWDIEGSEIVYTDLDGQPQKIDAGNVDIEASEELTAIRAGREYVPSEKAKALREAQQRAAELTPVVVYQGWRCGACDAAKQLLERLDVPYMEKDGDNHRPTTKELRKKVGKTYILPVLEFATADGLQYVIGYREREIRRLVRELKDQAAERSHEAGIGEPTTSEAAGEGNSPDGTL